MLQKVNNKFNNYIIYKTLISRELNNQSSN